MQILYRIGYLILALIALAGAAYYMLQLRDTAHDATKAAQTSQVNLEATQATQVSREVKRRSTEAKHTRVQASVATTLKSHEDFNSTPVPQEVQDELCKAIRCTSAASGASGLPDSASADNGP